MQVEYRKKFLKELSKLPAEYAKTIEEFVFDDLQNEKIKYSKELSKHSISFAGRFWSKKVIENEMNLMWIKDDINEKT